MALKETEIIEVTASAGFTVGRCDPPNVPPPDTGPKPPCAPECLPARMPTVPCAPFFGPTPPPPPRPN